MGGMNCTITNNRIEGQGSIFLGSAWNNTVTNNTLYVSAPGSIWVQAQANNNIITDNTVTGVKYDSQCTGIRSVMSDNNLYARNRVENFSIQMMLSCSDNNIIDNNEISGSVGFDYAKGGGIVLYRSDDNWITSNTISSVLGPGIKLFGGATGNEVRGNSVSDSQNGVELYFQASENTIVNNTISDCPVGLRLVSSGNNTIALNNVENNTIQAYDDGINAWSIDGLGNYWSNYDGEDIDGDGIGDSVFPIPINTKDPSPIVSSVLIETPDVPDQVPLPFDLLFTPKTFIDDDVVWDGKTIDTTARIVIEAGGKLTLDNSTLNLNSENDFTGILVNPGGALVIINSTLRSQGAYILAQKGASLRIEDSLLEKLGNWNGAGAVDVSCDGAVIKNCVIDGGYTGIKLNDGASNFEFIGNTVRKVYQGLHVCCSLSQSNIIENNVFEDIIRDAINIYSPVENSRIVGNHFKNVWGDAITVWGEPIIETDPWGNEIANNEYENCPPSMELESQTDVANNLTDTLWAQAILEVPGNPVMLNWKMVGADITPAGDQVVSGYFYADPDDFAYGSLYNPEVFVKVYITPNGWANMAFNHVTVDPVSIYTSHNNPGLPSQTGVTTLSNRLVEHQYDGVAIDETLRTTGETATASSSDGYMLSSDLWAKAVLQPATGAVNLIWKEVGTDNTLSGDTVISGYFYASPEDFPYGSQYNPEVFVKVYIALNGWTNMAFNHVTVDAVDISSAKEFSGSIDQFGTATLNDRLLEHQYDGVDLQ